MQNVSYHSCGSWTHKLDPKNRIAIPGDWRPSDDTPLLLLSSSREGLPTIKVYTQQCFLQIVEQIKASDFSFAAKDAYIGRMYANSVECLVNSQGKLLVPKNLAEHAKIESLVKIASRGEYFELWEPTLFEEAEEKTRLSTMDINNMFAIF